MGRLVVTIEEGQYVKIGDTILTVSKVKGKSAKLAIQAPKEVKVLRGTLIEKESSKDE
jgi:sRNA-binding carbon storage regulator CsrA